MLPYAANPPSSYPKQPQTAAGSFAAARLPWAAAFSFTIFFDFVTVHTFTATGKNP
jgi:hypothetical protein